MSSGSGVLCIQKPWRCADGKTKIIPSSLPRSGRCMSPRACSASRIATSMLAGCPPTPIEKWSQTVLSGCSAGLPDPQPASTHTASAAAAARRHEETGFAFFTGSKVNWPAQR